MALKYRVVIAAPNKIQRNTFKSLLFAFSSYDYTADGTYVPISLLAAIQAIYCFMGFFGVSLFPNFRKYKGSLVVILIYMLNLMDLYLMYASHFDDRLSYQFLVYFIISQLYLFNFLQLIVFDTVITIGLVFALSLGKYVNNDNVLEFLLSYVVSIVLSYMLLGLRLSIVEDLKKSKEEMTTFAFISSHDLKEPLRIISNFLQIIVKRKGDTLDAETSETLELAINQSRYMQTLINDILVFTREDFDEVNLKKVDMNQIFNLVLEANSQYIKERNAKITVEVFPVIKSNEGVVSTVFQNLLMNGIKFNQSEVPEVKISNRIVGDFLQICFEDNGIGIDSAYHIEVFKLFKRLNSKDEYEGTGLGLAYCKKVIERMGGRIWVMSEVDKGSRFYISLPMYFET